MDCGATDLCAARSPGQAGSSGRRDGLRARLYHEAVRAGLLVHREYAPAVMRGLTDEQRKAICVHMAAQRTNGREPRQTESTIASPTLNLSPDYKFP
jgi:hypothetical protein